MSSRRDFFKKTSSLFAGFLFLTNSRTARSYAANAKIDIALVGVSGRGQWFVSTMPRLDANVVAMCDVNDQRSAEAFARIPSARKFNDFRKMLDQIGKQLDGIVVAAPDHNHAVISGAAIQTGKHVYCEKPLTHDIYEARRLHQLALKHGVITQMGNQGTASSAFRQAVEIIQSGMLGEIREVHAWNTGGGAGETPLPSGHEPVPDYLNWDVWLGPASERPFHPEWLKWHRWRDFATGQLGNWAVHTTNVVFKGMQVDALWTQPNQIIQVQAETSGIHAATFPRWEIIQYDIPARNHLPPFSMHWYNGPGQAPGPRDMIEKKMGRKLDWGDAGEKKWSDHAGCLLIGEKGMLHSTGHNTTFTLLPEEKFRDVELPQPTLPRSPGHEQEWIRGCQGEGKPMSSFDYGSRLTEFVLLGNIATQFEEPIKFNPFAMKIANLERANDKIHAPYRAGWERYIQ
ncbi:MAG: Gfo/Idh/MocA family oxidoreductase [Candidatus Omnitrophica bacterium]|nr:Gfo/Idh/MocA family oxidoreductase [Candidatus Omnitrophota bacterium]